MSDNKKIIDADLHVQDPHEIILGYFNTNNDVDFVKGDYKKFKKRMGILAGVLIFMKFFFQEMFVSKLFTFKVLLVSILIGLICVYVLPFFMRIIHHGSKDGVRGIFYQIVFITIIVILVGAIM